ncbi:MAG: methyltransferase [Gammaproteobacteria bacterium RIFCSPHIGHO2_12_FULL_63_22]|nr:MAG: methyltransferase [Gammaproteobacteria bacterium RIFCSPHIGHO2_12_FULL_63_22]
MSQNTSHAVMAQRAEPNDSLDHFPTPPWATRALCEHVIELRGRTVWEPACGEGKMAAPLKEYALTVVASDVHHYGYGYVHDFLWVPQCLTWDGKNINSRPDWVITNPPFRLAEQFVKRGMEIANEGVAVLVRSVFIESIGRYENLFRHTPPAVMAQFVERVPMVKGRLDRNASTATSYCWLVWRRGSSLPSRLQWIPPCRAKLERDGDYA